MSWYVLHVSPLREIDVRDGLIKKGYEAAVPREMAIERSGGTWRERIRLFFPSYVFVRCDMTDADYYALTNTDYVLRILGRPTPIDADEALYIEYLTPTREPLNHSRAIRDGDRIRVISGPLVGKEARIVKIEQRAKRATVRIALFREIHDIKMSLDIVAGPQGS
ncbi:KOW motif-containing protein [Christensenellaceae bacterium OttesenSCG-928-M15]|nr:KOW motif-containing protein [Christensenellaceae bacterium OttesenSCG-928-M15]